MKKIMVLSVGTLLLFSSCGTYAGSGAATGGWFGSIIGSAVGGITGGPRGSDIGSLIGMAGGAVVGAAIGQAADNAQQQRLEDYRRQRQQQRYEQQRYDEGDDRLYGFDENFGSTHAPMAYATEPCLEIRNPRIVDASRDGVLTRGEEARMVFEIYNTSTKPVTRVLPAVAEVTGNKHIRVSENVMVESVLPGKGIRYTAVIRADNGLRDGEAIFRISVYQGNREETSQVREFRIMTSKR